MRFPLQNDAIVPGPTRDIVVIIAPIATVTIQTTNRINPYQIGQQMCPPLQGLQQHVVPRIPIKIAKHENARSIAKVIV